MGKSGVEVVRGCIRLEQNRERGVIFSRVDCRNCLWALLADRAGMDRVRVKTAHMLNLE
jgi:hypothetical protein